MLNYGSTSRYTLYATRFRENRDSWKHTVESVRGDNISIGKYTRIVKLPAAGFFEPAAVISGDIRVFNGLPLLHD